MHNNPETDAPLNGALAFVRGFGADACPFAVTDPGYEVWLHAYSTMAAAKARAEARELAEPYSTISAPTYQGNIVKERYRRAYAQAGHPRHCGDELAVLLNRLCLGDEAFDLERFEAILAANGVNVARYKRRLTRGWEGRLRMTGRNLLAPIVRRHNGQLKMPEGDVVHQLSEAWLCPNEKPKIPNIMERTGV